MRTCTHRPPTFLAALAQMAAPPPGHPSPVSPAAHLEGRGEKRVVDLPQPAPGARQVPALEPRRRGLVEDAGSGRVAENESKDDAGQLPTALARGAGETRARGRGVDGAHVSQGRLWGTAEVSYRDFSFFFYVCCPLYLFGEQAGKVGAAGGPEHAHAQGPVRRQGPIPVDPPPPHTHAVLTPPHTHIPPPPHKAHTTPAPGGDVSLHGSTGATKTEADFIFIRRPTLARPARAVTQCRSGGGAPQRPRRRHRGARRPP